MTRRSFGAAALALVALCPATGTTASARGKGFDYAARIAVGVANSKNGFCLNTDARLAPGTKIAVIWADGRQSVTTGVVGEALPGGCAINGDAFSNSFALSREAGPTKETEIGIAIIDPPGPVRVRRGQAEIDLDGDGKPERFRVCTSHEGLHLTVWSGAPLRSVRRWHQYFPLGYDAIPSCSGKDT